MNCQHYCNAADPPPRLPSCSTSVPTDPASPIPHKQRIPFYVIGNEAGFFPSVVKKTAILIGPAERYDIIIDFSHVPAGEKFVYMLNEGPETPYDGMNNGEALTIHTTQVIQLTIHNLSLAVVLQYIAG